MSNRVEELRARLMGKEGRVASGLSRLWQSGRGAAGMASVVLGARRRGPLDGVDVEEVARLVERLGELKGVAMKAGQILGYVDPSLPPELRQILSLLQTAAPQSSFAHVEHTIQAAFGERAAALLAGLEHSPIAVASIGQVHRATLPSGAKAAVKVRHEGIEAALASDFKAASFGSAIAGSLFSVAGGSVRSFVDEARAALLAECDYGLEAERQELFGRLYAADADIVIPPVVTGFCGDGVLTTGWRPGRSLDDWLAAGPSQAARNRIGEALFRFYVGTLYRHGWFHADPHPGNYGFQDDGRIVIYDFGCVRHFDAATVRAFASLVPAVRRDDGEAMATALEALGATPKPEVTDHLRRLLRGFFGPLLSPGRARIAPDQGTEARQLMSDKRAIMQLALPGKLLFLFRLRFGLYAVLSRLEAEVDWATLEAGWAERALGASLREPAFESSRAARESASAPSAG